MKYCVFCGEKIEDDSTFCPHCGGKQEGISCSNEEMNASGEETNTFHNCWINTRNPWNE